MQLTKGQKDALMRKALQIVDKKRAEKKSELVAHYKPSQETKRFLSKVSNIQALILRLNDAFKDAGFTKEYSSYKATIDGQIVSVSFYDIQTLNGNIYSTIENDLMNKIINIELEKTVNYPDAMTITDDIEFLNLNKNFNVDEFLAKYNNL